MPVRGSITSGSETCVDLKSFSGEGLRSSLSRAWTSSRRSDEGTVARTHCGMAGTSARGFDIYGSRKNESRDCRNFDETSQPSSNDVSLPNDPFSSFVFASSFFFLSIKQVRYQRTSPVTTSSISFIYFSLFFFERKAKQPSRYCHQRIWFSSRYCFIILEVVTLDLSSAESLSFCLAFALFVNKIDFASTKVIFTILSPGPRKRGLSFLLSSLGSIKGDTLSLVGRPCTVR
mmetsp:Transcript_24039/g.37819  ORF Transcript_24039/g.37819 Transcript_24039/m.37819 type:complete len:232 (-) Transcript_24039:2669-3364(-)